MASSVIRGISLSSMPSSASDRGAEPTGELPQLPRRVCRAAERPGTARRSRREWGRLVVAQRVRQDDGVGRRVQQVQSAAEGAWQSLWCSDIVVAPMTAPHNQAP
jgi:hypothetical protein